MPGFAYRAYRMAREWTRDTQRIHARFTRMRWQLQQVGQAALERLEALAQSREIQRELGLRLKEAYAERNRLESTVTAKLLRNVGRMLGK
jgi:hypothetical protein